MGWVRRALVAGVLPFLALAGCGSEEGGASREPSSPAGPPRALLRDALLVPGDVPGQWEVDSEGTQGGVIEFCEDAGAESRRAAEELQFQAGVTMRGVAEPGATGAAYVGQFLLADQPQAVEATFDALHAGALACYGKPLVPEEDYGTSRPFDLPPVGDARFGEHHVMGSDTAGYGSHLHMAVVRDGPVLMLLTVWEFLGGEGDPPQVTAEDVAAITTTAVGKLP